MRIPPSKWAVACVAFTFGGGAAAVVPAGNKVTSSEEERLSVALSKFESDLEPALHGTDAERATAMRALCAIASPSFPARADEQAAFDGRLTQLALLQCADGDPRPPGTEMDRILREALRSTDEKLLTEAAIASYKRPPQFDTVWDPATATYLWRTFAEHLWAHTEGIAAVQPWKDQAWSSVARPVQQNLEAFAKSEVPKEPSPQQREALRQARKGLRTCGGIHWSLWPYLTTRELKVFALCDADHLYWQLTHQLRARSDPFTSADLDALEARFTKRVEPRQADLLRMERWRRYAQEGRFTEFAHGLELYAFGQLTHEDVFSEALDTYGRGRAIPDALRHRMLPFARIDGGKLDLPVVYGIMAGPYEESALWKRLQAGDAAPRVLGAASEVDSPRGRELKQRLRVLNEGVYGSVQSFTPDEIGCPAAALEGWNVFALSFGPETTRPAVERFLQSLRDTYQGRESERMLVDFLRVRSGGRNLDSASVGAELVLDPRDSIQARARWYYRLPQLREGDAREVIPSSERRDEMRQALARRLEVAPRLDTKWTDIEERWWKAFQAAQITLKVGNRVKEGARWSQDAGYFQYARQPFFELELPALDEGFREAPSAVQALLSDSNASVRLRAAEELWAFERSPAARDTLATLASDPLLLVRLGAVRAFAAFRIPDGHDVLIRSLKDGDVAVRRVARTGLARIGTATELALLSQSVLLDEIDTRLLQELSRREEPPAADLVERWLRSDSWPRNDVLKALGKVRRAGHIRHLLGLLGSSDFPAAKKGRLLVLLRTAAFEREVGASEVIPTSGTILAELASWRVRLEHDPVDWFLDAVDPAHSRDPVEIQTIAAWSATPEPRPSFQVWAAGAGRTAVETVLSRNPFFEEDFLDSPRLSAALRRALALAFEGGTPLNSDSYPRARALTRVDYGNPVILRCDLRTEARRKWGDALR